MVMYILDTNMVSYIVKGRSLAASDQLINLSSNEVAAVSAITVAEIRYGLAKKPEATALKSLMDSFLASIQVLAWGTDEAEVYGTIRAKLEKKGITLGNMDMMIAAHAIVNKATLVTNDKAFAQVDELSSPVNWATDL
ncbi:MAG: type II toxin-antitoxin system VapC family toxin [Janthinobacterium lividum]